MVLKKEGGIGNKLIILILVILFIILFGTFGFYLTQETNLAKSFITTIEVLSFVHYEEIMGSAKIVKILLSLFGVIFFWLAIWEAFDIAVESKFINNFQEVKIMNQIKKLKNHYIICGGGRVGHHVAEMLKNQNKPYVIIERDEFMLNQLRKKGFLVYEGDTLEEYALKQANVAKAKVLMAVLPQSEKNILIILTARELNKKLKIYARSNREEYVKRMKKAGADFIVTPEVSCAEELIRLTKK